MESIEKKKKSTRSMPVICDYFTAAKKYPLVFSLIFIGSLVIELSGVVAPLFIKQFIDRIATGDISDAAITSLLLVLLSYSGIVFIGWIGRRIQMISLMNLEARVMVDLYNKAFAYLIGHSHDFFTKNFAGSLQRRVSRYAQSFESVLDIFTFGFFSTGVFAIGVIVVLTQRNLFLGLGLLVWTVVFIWIQTMMTRWRQPLRVARSAEESNVTGVLSDSVSNQSTISLFAANTHERGILGSALDKWYRATMRSWNADAWIMGVQGLLAIAIEIAILAGSVLLWREGLLTVGDFVLIQVYILTLIDRVWGIGNSMRRLFSAFADANEMIEIFNTKHSVEDVKGARPLLVDKGEIQMEGVSFAFSEERTILSDFNLQVQAGEKVALVGPSGAGKSTVTKLLLRMYDVTGGSIRVDGQDISQVTQESLRATISFVPQEPILFHRSLKDNIRYGRPDATDEEVIEAAKKAHCHEFIVSLAEGYETHVGERGVKLSGGERQRVAIARAILKNAPILILDEATSALDSESEALIQDALRVLMEGKTVIVIAHRLSTIMTMDRIIVIEGGKIAAEGTHDELVTHTGGLYQKLWSIQAGGFVNDTKEQ
ncbi:MAG: ATP-binding cassette, subfamily bacterial [Patescibacteria group bacterium]|nr:ATP-binding cassette, subfamily bacterial [Patescibacteria group bacterium]